MGYFPLVLLSVAALGGLSAVAALLWAIDHRQFRHPRHGAASIFDAEEPIGRVTDRFPSSRVSRDPHADY